MNEPWNDRVKRLLRGLYPAVDPDALFDSVVAAAGIGPDETATGTPTTRWTEADIVVIAYGDSVVDGVRPPLAVLAETAERLWAGRASTIHVLPFFPYSSDRGFAVIDHREVDPDLGSWADIEAVRARFDLMVDVVANHVSAESAWFRQYLAGENPGAGFFIEVEAGTDLSEVVRPRALPLTYPFETPTGSRQVWCTFSDDQVDLDWTNPEVLLAMLHTVDVLVENGARFLRLDAIAYLWKELGTSCIHRPQTHEMVKLLRALLEVRAPGASIITETNVPSAENLSYLGGDASDEAHIVYNFPLAPLLLDAISRGRSDTLAPWLSESPALPRGCTQLNFLASHDGFGLRPAEGLLADREIDALVELNDRCGGYHGTYSTADGDRPYELNCSLWDLLGAISPGGRAHRVARLLGMHAILLALQGIPALYINSLLAVPGDRATAEATGVRRDINRARIAVAEIDALLADRDDPRTQAIEGLNRLMALRVGQPAFHPSSAQEVMTPDPRVLAIRRESTTQSIIAVHNLSATTMPIDWASLDPTEGERVDLTTGEPVDPSTDLGPYEFVWASSPARRGNAAI